MDNLPHYSAWYEITLLECGPHKLDVIKLVREYRYLCLKESKQLVESVPQAAAYTSANDWQEAMRCKERFEALGAKVAMELHFPIMDGPGYYDE